MDYAQATVCRSHQGIRKRRTMINRHCVPSGAVALCFATQLGRGLFWRRARH